ncbi:hypothetical protein [Paraburkholderia sp. ZP32-5]|uniref:hypothetical protein n=1 Tax=Paraburkholderia sp. ZP32-5 TaxID=2883245 RepID=UPI001F35493D|nr:hypothetical protein [Paraburkholderia sp. ZP32-5]
MRAKQVEEFFKPAVVPKYIPVRLFTGHQTESRFFPMGLQAVLPNAVKKNLYYKDNPRAVTRGTVVSVSSLVHLGTKGEGTC